MHPAEAGLDRVAAKAKRYAQSPNSHPGGREIQSPSSQPETLFPVRQPIRGFELTIVPRPCTCPNRDPNQKAA